MNDYNGNNNDYSYKVMMDGMNKSRAWSVASFAVALASVLCCCLSWFGLVTGVLAIVFAVVSRKTIGYFDGLAIAGLIIGIFGLVFGISNVILDYIITNTDLLSDFMAEYEKLLEEYMGEIENMPDV